MGASHLVPGTRRIGGGSAQATTRRNEEGDNESGSTSLLSTYISHISSNINIATMAKTPKMLSNKASIADTSIHVSPFSGSNNRNDQPPCIRYPVLALQRQAESMSGATVMQPIGADAHFFSFQSPVRTLPRTTCPNQPWTSGR